MVRRNDQVCRQANGSFRSSAGGCRRSGARGFSLVEIVLAMAIMAVLMAVAVPNFNKILAWHQLDTAARQLAADLRETRERAKTERVEYGVVFYQPDHSPYPDEYHIKKKIEGKKLSDPATPTVRAVELPHQVEMYHNTFDEEALLPNENNVRFNVLSGAPLPHGGRVELKNRSTGESRYVIVAPHTGRVRISDEPP